MQLKISNIYEARPAGEIGERFIPLIDIPDLRLEQIISHGQSTETDCWYDQPRPEWVLLAQGNATLRFQGEERVKYGIVELKAGDFLLIPAHLKHRVESCSDDARWLALHFTSRAELPI